MNGPVNYDSQQLGLRGKQYHNGLRALLVLWPAGFDPSIDHMVFSHKVVRNMEPGIIYSVPEPRQILTAPPS